MVRLQRVTVLALHNYLGLTNELFSHVSYSVAHAKHADSAYKTLCHFNAEVQHLLFVLLSTSIGANATHSMYIKADIYTVHRLYWNDA